MLLCRDEENDPRSPVKNGDMDINGNTPFLKVLQGLFQSFFSLLCFFQFPENLKEKGPLKSPVIIITKFLFKSPKDAEVFFLNFAFFLLQLLYVLFGVRSF